MVEEDEETGSAGWKQIAVGDPLKLTRQCQQIGRGSERGWERGSPWRETVQWNGRKRRNEKVMRR